MNFRHTVATVSLLVAALHAEWVLAPSAFAQTNPVPYVVGTLAGHAGYGSVDAAGSAARLHWPSGLAVDGAGNLYVADTANHTIRKVTPAGFASTLAGQPDERGSADGPRLAARFDQPQGIAIDGAGNLYVADTANHTIRKISPAGTVSTLAGRAGSEGSADGPGSEARFKEPEGLAVDSTGNLYVADAGNHTIRKITPAGLVTTLAGLAGAAGSTDGPGLQARFTFPRGLAVDAAGQVFVADTSSHTVRKITPAGTVSTLAGAAGQSGSTNGIAGAARFHYPESLALDSAGNLLVADTDNHAVRKVTPAGVVTTLAGALGTPGIADGAGAAARFYFPESVVVDRSGNIYVADTASHTLRKITGSGAVSTLAGRAGGAGYANGSGEAARFWYPSGVAVDPGGTAYVADSASHTIRKISTAGVVTTLAGLPAVEGSADGSGANARFFRPSGVALDAAGNVFVADTWNHTVRKITPAGSVSTLAGLAGSEGSSNGTGSAARFYWPSSLAVDADGYVYVADAGNHLIRRISPAGLVSTWAGRAGEGGNADGPAIAARFLHPRGLALDSGGNVYVADTDNHTIRKISPFGVVATLAGLAGNFGAADGPGATARFEEPQGVAVDGTGDVFVADWNHALRRITPAGLVTTLAGLAYRPGSADGAGSAARFKFPRGVAVDPAGNIYVADTMNHTIRKGTPPSSLPRITSQPRSQTVPQGARVTLSVSVSGAAPFTFQWQKDGLNLAGATASTYTLANVQPVHSGSYAVVVTDKNRNALTSESATLTVTDLARPTLTVAEPRSGSRWQHPEVLLRGTASDNVAVAEVLWSPAGADEWQAAVGTTSWQTTVRLRPGTNGIRVQAVDTSGNRSATNSLTLIHVVSDRLELQVSGTGSITPNLHGQMLEVGRAYTLTALPGLGLVFSNWTQLRPGAPVVSSSQPRFSFLMQSNLLLQANFVPNPFAPFKGAYNGLFLPAASTETAVTNAGFLTLALSDRGLASGKLLLEGKTYTLSRVQFDLEGRAQTRVNRLAPLPQLTVDLHLDLANPAGVLTGTVSAGTWQSNLRAFLGGPRPAWLGSYTWALEGGEVSNPTTPPGHGAGTLVVDARGGVRLAGSLADGTVLSLSSSLSQDGWCPIYAPLQAGRGMLLGWLQFSSTEPGHDLVGARMVWVKHPATSAQPPPSAAGFALQRRLLGSRYRAPAAGQGVLSWSQGNIELVGGNLTEALNLEAAWINNRLVVTNNPPRLTLTVTLPNGLFNGSFVHPQTGKPTSLKGALLQGPATGSGWFLGPNQGGSIRLAAD